MSYLLKCDNQSFPQTMDHAVVEVELSAARTWRISWLKWTSQQTTPRLIWPTVPRTQRFYSSHNFTQTAARQNSKIVITLTNWYHT